MNNTSGTYSVSYLIYYTLYINFLLYNVRHNEGFDSYSFKTNQLKLKLLSRRKRSNLLKHNPPFACRRTY